ncbi:MAG: tRNA (adenosine(37)-N6)-threonylcarbamoyltransferase complex dimerization subunit type 1 TsaB [Novosphingobium sp.]|nr:tRNA (adenosine(37)-N6)-threonylcarbamoyltransferase complex dimerization subunit type 1 TsaB [Novosphingobium sp.]
MRTLAIDSATAACSVALLDGEALVAGDCAVLGRGHAERLVPMIAALPDRGRADRICVSLGPGSFTGVRVGLAAARALALAWKADILGFPTLELVAAMARRDRGDRPVTVAMTGGHGEWFVQRFTSAARPAGPLTSLRPEDAVTASTDDLIAGSEADAFVALRGHGTALPLLPDTRALPLLPPMALTRALQPLYGRAPDARLPVAAR